LNSNGNKNNGRRIKESLNANQNENVNYETSIFNQQENNGNNSNNEYNNNNSSGNNANNGNNGKVRLKNIFNNEQGESQENKKKNNSSKSFLSSIGNTLSETFGLSTQTPTSENNVNKINTIIKSECEGEDCDVFSNSNTISKINSKLGNNFNNPKTRFKRARNTLNNLLGREVNYSKKTRTGNIANIPITGDVFTYLEKT
jgi:hypothetical protein